MGLGDKLSISYQSESDASESSITPSSIEATVLKILDPHSCIVQLSSLPTDCNISVLIERIERSLTHSHSTFVQKVTPNFQSF